MKKFKQLLVPAVIILMGAGAAFATNAAKDSDSDLVTGYYIDSSTSQCIAADKQCSRSGTNACTWEDNNKLSHDLYELSGTSCVLMLFEPEP
jgi:hypothetical protein